ncbi:MAG TPA: cysteine synthase A [Spirochaetota bacterium]|nr:cysteine synthase A [Spirochaetota bacterium]
MNIAADITKLIGSTPLVKINKMTAGTRVAIWAKLEYFNPLASIKDRIALSMIEAAEKKGQLAPEGVIIEPTSGNTGIGLAYIAAVKGYTLILTMPESMSMERRKLLKLFGAEVVLTRADKGMQGAIDKADALAKKIPNSFQPQQFTNPANPAIHRKTTAREIWDDTDGRVDILVAGIGTGGTITGTGEALQKKKPQLKIIGVEPETSAVLNGTQAGPHKIQGIGAGFIPAVLNTKIYDRIIKITDEKAAATARDLARKEGLLTGISSGAAMAAALQISRQKENYGKNIVVILPDTGERYLSTFMFNA